ncbi:small GTP-binding protein [Histomonas meleagridis]|uniref:small GTP-binding protein n=1 Tax=Histomonas meleagridis TaxID=135588 RepID=UPI00355A9F9B|nr:small GTP-binding protein [Histomonas meleagridis]KAH0806270.1 small GTP-binding protein [Histomonas meleagridis]
MSTQSDTSSKVILLGDSSVGKSSIVYQLYKKQFKELNEPTIGTSYISHTFVTSNGSFVLHIWDTAGQERYRSIIPMYSRDCAASIFVFSIDMPESFENLPMWFEMLELKCGQTSKKYVVANKIDLDQNSPLIENAKTFCEDRGCPFFATSAKDHTSVLALFQSIANDLSNEIAIAKKSESLDININQEKKTCCK